MKSIEKKFGILKERLGKLKTLSKNIKSFEQYISSTDSKDIAERNVQVAIETCLDISKIIISALELHEPKDNKGVFTVLAEANILSENSLKFLIPMAGTRNILVHGYDKVEDNIIYGVLKRHLGDFDLFLKEIQKNFIDKREDSPKNDA